MAIIGTLPFTITNGQVGDAAPVMADMNYIVSQVNTNAAASVNKTYCYVMAKSPGAMTSAVDQVELVTAGSPTIYADSLSEFNAVTGRVTIKNAGYYDITWGGNLHTYGATFTSYAGFFIYQNNLSPFAGTGTAVFAEVGLGLTGSLSSSTSMANCIVHANVNDWFNVRAIASFSVGAPFVEFVWIKIVRVDA